MTVSLRNTPLLVLDAGATAQSIVSSWNGTTPVISDLLVAVVQFEATLTTALGTAPGGWNLSSVNETNAASTEVRVAVYTRTAAGNSSDNAPTWTGTLTGTSPRYAGQVTLYDFYDSSGATPALALTGVAQGTSATIAPATVPDPAAGSYAIAAVSAYGSSAVTWTTPSSGGTWVSEGVSTGGSAYYSYANYSLAAPSASGALTCSMAHSAGTTTYEAAFVLVVSPPVIPATLAVTTAAPAPAVAVPETSPGLEIYGFAISGPGAADTIEHVTVTVTEHQSSASQAPCSIALWNGTTAQIGTTQTGTASTSTANTSIAVFTGVTYSQLATLRVRVYGNGVTGSGYIESVDSVAVTVSYMPASAANATVTMGSALTVTGSMPAPAASGSAVAAPVILAVTSATPGSRNLCQPHRRHPDGNRQ